MEGQNAQRTGGGWSWGKGEWERRVSIRVEKGVGNRGDEAKIGSRDCGIVSLARESWWNRT